MFSTNMHKTTLLIYDAQLFFFFFRKQQIVQLLFLKPDFNINSEF